LRFFTEPSFDFGVSADEDELVVVIDPDDKLGGVRNYKNIVAHACCGQGVEGEQCEHFRMLIG